MLRRNMGGVDRTLRFIAALALIPIGLVALGGWWGDAVGILVAAIAVLLLGTSLTGFCPGYVPLGLSTLRSRRDPTAPSAP